MTDNTTKTEDNASVYENEILYWLDQYAIEKNIASFDEIDQSKWNAVLLYINRHCFGRNPERLKQTKNVYEGSEMRMKSTCNAYDYKAVDKILDIYLNLCFEFGKEISIMGFSNLVGIDYELMWTWGNYETANKESSKIYKKLIRFREETLSDRLYSGKANPVGILGILNRHYGWNMGQPRTAAPSNQQSIEQIKENYSQVTGPNEQTHLLPVVDLTED